MIEQTKRFKYCCDELKKNTIEGRLYREDNPALPGYPNGFPSPISWSGFPCPYCKSSIRLDLVVALSTNRAGGIEPPFYVNSNSEQGVSVSGTGIDLEWKEQEELVIWAHLPTISEFSPKD
ncbi:MAG: hypothetical protein GY928_34130 [Colwellia sp.]|nr:hypothetical protein [Colwellia sp.]